MDDYTKMDGPELIHACGQDATKWTEALCQKHPHLRPDADLLFGWFANAIVHSLDLERGTVINGEHAEYLLEHGLSPTGAKQETPDG